MVAVITAIRLVARRITVIIHGTMHPVDPLFRPTRISTIAQMVQHVASQPQDQESGRSPHPAIGHRHQQSGWLGRDMAGDWCLLWRKSDGCGHRCRHIFGGNGIERSSSGAIGRSHILRELQPDQGVYGKFYRKQWRPDYHFYTPRLLGSQKYWIRRENCVLGMGSLIYLLGLGCRRRYKYFSI
jgi:hypothetical protein